MIAAQGILRLCYAALQARMIRVGGCVDALAHVQKITAKIDSKTVKRTFCAVRHLEFRLGTMDVGIEPPFLGIK